MAYTRWRNNLIHWMTIVLVAGMLPLSCIVHCHVNALPLESSARTLFVCHPMTAVDTDTPPHLHAHTVALRATHEVVILVALGLVSMLVQSELMQRGQAFVRWYPTLNTPPPRRIALIL